MLLTLRRLRLRSLGCLAGWEPHSYGGDLLGCLPVTSDKGKVKTTSPKITSVGDGGWVGRGALRVQEPKPCKPPGGGRHKGQLVVPAPR